MAKKGMKRPDDWHGNKNEKKNKEVPELEGKAKHGKEKAEPI